MKAHFAHTTNAWMNKHVQNANPAAKYALPAVPEKMRHILSAIRANGQINPMSAVLPNAAQTKRNALNGQNVRAICPNARGIFSMNAKMIHSLIHLVSMAVTKRITAAICATQIQRNV